MKKSIGPVVLSLSVLGCGSVQVKDYANVQPKLQLESYLNGKLEAQGIVSDRGGRVTRHFNCTMEGSWTTSGEGVLKEVFTWSDGEIQHRTWKLRKTADGEYVGTAEDVVGEARGQASGNAFHWTYTLRVPVKGKTFDIAVDDWMYLVTDKVLINKSKLSKFGFDVGEVTLSMRKL